jgi:EpsI family protein
MTRRLLILIGTLVVGAAVIRAASVQEIVRPRLPLARVPLVMGDWRWRRELALDEGTLKVLNADDYVSRSYVSGAMAADLFIGYYATQRQGDTMHSPMNCLPAAGWQPMSIGRMQVPVDGATPVNANRYVIQRGLDKRLVLFWYQSHGRTIASDYASKAYLVLDALRLHRSDAAIVRVIAPLTSGEMAADRAAADFVHVLQPVLDRYLPN